MSAVKLGFTRRVLSQNPHFWQRRPEAGHPSVDNHKLDGQHFWMKRYYDSNIYSDPKIAEKLRYMHQNPVIRGLVGRAEKWEWSISGFMRTERAGL
jgi:hypothetical protein